MVIEVSILNRDRSLAHISGDFVTVDYETLEDNCVTLRFRDTMEQERVPISELQSIIEDKVSIVSLLKKLQ